MKILDSKSYCAICHKPIKLNNLGAVIINKVAENVCQDPCAIEYHQRMALTPIIKVVEEKEKTFVQQIEELQRRIRQPQRNPFVEVEEIEAESLTTVNVIDFGNTKILEHYNQNVQLPVEIFYNNLLVNQNITKFALLSSEIINHSNFPISISLKENENYLTYFVYLCTAYSLINMDLAVPLIIKEIDLILRIESSQINDEQPFIDFTSKLTIQPIGD